MATEADFKRIGNYARMYNKDQGISRRHSKRTVPLEVLSLGYSRTGTMTMHKVFSILGYPAYHFSSFYDNKCESDMWMEAINAKFYGRGEMPDKAFFDGILGHIGATTDSPCNLFGRELVQFYPDAKVVLVERDIESWFRSWMSFCKDAYNPMIHLLGRLNPGFLGKMAQLGDAITVIQSGHSKNLDEVRVRCKDAYRHHYQDVVDFTPPDRLLKFKLADGWEPLCKFLGKPVPVCKFSIIQTMAYNGTGRAIPSRERCCFKPTGFQGVGHYRHEINSNKYGESYDRYCSSGSILLAPAKSLEELLASQYDHSISWSAAILLHKHLRQSNSWLEFAFGAVSIHGCVGDVGGSVVDDLDLSLILQVSCSFICVTRFLQLNLSTLQARPVRFVERHVSLALWRQPQYHVVSALRTLRTK
jgi:hypothetical protein